jgi:two-component system, cell cycle response regulator
MDASQSVKTRILVVDDSRLMRKAAIKMLEAEFDIVVAEDGLEAWELLQSDTKIQVVFTDLSMPRCDGYELLKLVRASEESGLQNTPMIVITGAENDEGARQKALDAGATDFITKPFTSIDVLARARAHANYQRITRQLQAQATMDALTGLANKTGFLDRLQQDISYARRHQHSLALVRLEIDNLRSIFLEQGRNEAEFLIRHIAQLLRSRIRKEDSAARIGLGSFVLSLPSGKVDGLQGMLQRLHAEVVAQPPELNGRKVLVTFKTTVLDVEVGLGPNAADVLVQCDNQFAAMLKGEVPAPVQVIEAPTPAPTAVAQVQEAEPIRIDEMLKHMDSGDTETVTAKMSQILRRLLPLFRLLTQSQRMQLIAFLQKL